MAPFEKILVAIDFSRSSQRALVLAVELAKKLDASITLLHVYSIPTYPLPEGYIIASPETVAELMQKTSLAMKDVKTRAVGLGATRVETQLVEGSAFPDIVRIANEQRFDLVVMGTHGRSGFAHALMGSVAEKVVRRAHCPVLTVRDPDQRIALP
jgi:nucleotide-binding universal stress UspA family protein